MPNNVNTAPSLPNGSHGLSSSPNPSPLQQVPSLVDVDQLKQECHSTRLDVTEHELHPHRNVELLYIVPWREPEEADYVTVFCCPSTSRASAPADLGSSSDVDTVSVKTQHSQQNLSDGQSLLGESNSGDASSTLDGPRDHLQSIGVTSLDLEGTLSSPTIVYSDTLDIFPELLYFPDPSELTLPKPYPTAIIEDTLSLYYHDLHSEHIISVPARKGN